MYKQVQNEWLSAIITSKCHLEFDCSFIANYKLRKFLP
jgi:hypothetical protein